jgi:hypothetical protein
MLYICLVRLLASYAVMLLGAQNIEIVYVQFETLQQGRVRTVYFMPSEYSIDLQHLQCERRRIFCAFAMKFYNTAEFY